VWTDTHLVESMAANWAPLTVDWLAAAMVCCWDSQRVGYWARSTAVNWAEVTAGCSAELMAGRWVVLTAHRLVAWRADHSDRSLVARSADTRDGLTAGRWDQW
jgi:hypothetical protein